MVTANKGFLNDSCTIGPLSENDPTNMRLLLKKDPNIDELTQSGIPT